MKFASFLSSHAFTQGEKDALVCNGTRISFRELERSTNNVASVLRQSGIGVGDRVAIYVANGIEFALAFIGTVKAGALAVPINLPLSVPEVAHIVSDCAPKAAFVSQRTQSAFVEAIRGSSILTIGADEGCDADLQLAEMKDSGAGPAPADVRFDADDCMVAYTSGTTGRAKGVLLTQSNFVFVNGYLNGFYWGLSRDDRQLCTTPLAHRTGMARLINVLLHGSTLVIMPRFEAAEAADLVGGEQITVVGMVPTVGRLLLPEIEARPAKFASVRAVLVTGEAFPLDVKARLHAALPHAHFHSFYSMTEAGAITHLDPSEQFTRPASVGRRWPEVEVRLVSDSGATAVAGEAGEVWVRSGTPGVASTMRGYFNRPEATAETLRDGWVTTGDVGRFDDDGYLYLLDRKKDMVLSGGYNIYCKEVEVALQSHVDVVDAAVIGVPDAVYGESVAAYVERQPASSVDARQLVEHCRRLLASYKKPKYVLFIESLPRTSTGKVLKSALRDRFKLDISNLG